FRNGSCANAVDEKYRFREAKGLDFARGIGSSRIRDKHRRREVRDSTWLEASAPCGSSAHSSMHDTSLTVLVSCLTTILTSRAMHFSRSVHNFTGGRFHWAFRG